MESSTTPEAEPAAPESSGYQRTVYALKKSNIYLLEDGLVLQNDDGDEIARYKLAQLDKLNAIQRVSYVSLSILLAGLGIVALGYFVIEPSNWAWLAYALGGLIAIFGAIIIKSDILGVEVKDGRFEYTVQEDNEELSGFAYSVNTYIDESRTG